MARKSRKWFPGAIYHITARGNRKDTLFYETKDYQSYLELLIDCKKRLPFQIHAYCLMPNHIHLLLETQEIPPGYIIKDVHMKCAINFNKKYNLAGHLFQGRYNAKLILDDEYFLKVSQYIHLNPTKAYIVKKPEDYHWSSYATYLGIREDPVVTTDKTLWYFAEKEDYINYILTPTKEFKLT